MKPHYAEEAGYSFPENEAYYIKNGVRFTRNEDGEYVSEDDTECSEGGEHEIDATGHCRKCGWHESNYN